MALFFQGLWPSTIGIDDLQLLSFSADTVLCFSSISGHRNSMQKYLLTIWQHLITPPIYPNTLNLNRSSCLFLRDFNSNRLWSKLVQLANSKHDSFQTTLEQMSIHSCCPLLIIKTTNILIMMVLVCEAVLVFGEIEIGHWALFAKIATSPLCPNETDSKDPLKVHQRTRRLMAIPAPAPKGPTRKDQVRGLKRFGIWEVNNFALYPHTLFLFASSKWLDLDQSFNFLMFTLKSTPLV